MKPARIVLLLTMCLVGSALVLTAVPASSSSSDPAPSEVRTFVQKQRSAAFWRQAVKSARPIALHRGGRGVAAQQPATDDVGAPVVVPPTGPQGTNGDSLPEVVSFDGRRTLGSFPAVGFNRSEITDPSQNPFRRHGKIFFTQNGSTYVCSGTIVTGTNESVVATAGHCVYDDVANVANTSTMFVPGYKNNVAPFGFWDATEVLTTEKWMNGSTGDLRYDVGMIVLESQNGQTIQDLHGSRGIAFNQSATQQFDSYGYPATPPLFDGERLYVCESAIGYTDPQYTNPAPHAIGCDMNQGSSGGGWIISAPSGEVVNSVNSYLYENQRVVGLDLIFGPYFGTVAENLYNVAADNPTSGSPTPTASPSGTDPITHSSDLSLKLKKHLRAKGKLSSNDGYLGCVQQAPIGIYRLKDSTTGLLVGSVHNTNNSGAYSFKIPDRKGKYFANVFARDLDPANLCAQAQSPILKHKH